MITLQNTLVSKEGSILVAHVPTEERCPLSLQGHSRLVSVSHPAVTRQSVGGSESVGVAGRLVDGGEGGARGVM